VANNLRILGLFAPFASRLFLPGSPGGFRISHWPDRSGSNLTAPQSVWTPIKHWMRYTVILLNLTP
jgi:hypothetical protein